MTIHVNTVPAEGHTLVEVAGEIDLESSDALREQLSELFDGGHHRLILDMQGVTFLDSSGLRALIDCLERAQRQDGFLRLAGMREHVVKVFQITRMTTVFPIYFSVDQAIADEF